VTFDLRASTVTISPHEPALWLSVLLAAALAWPLGSGLGKLTALVTDPWRRWLYMGPVWIVAALAFYLLPNIVVSIIYPLVHPEDRGAIVCVVMVWPTFLLPAALGVMAAARTLRRSGSSGHAAKAV
jgi:hypothetical protein